jgi:hypothetical protein
LQSEVVDFAPKRARKICQQICDNILSEKIYMEMLCADKNEYEEITRFVSSQDVPVNHCLTIDALKLFIKEFKDKNNKKRKERGRSTQKKQCIIDDTHLTLQTNQDGVGKLIIIDKRKVRINPTVNDDGDTVYEDFDIKQELKELIIAGFKSIGNKQTKRTKSSQLSNAILECLKKYSVYFLVDELMYNESKEHCIVASMVVEKMAFVNGKDSSMIHFIVVDKEFQGKEYARKLLHSVFTSGEYMNKKIYAVTKLPETEYLSSLKNEVCFNHKGK